MVGLLAAGSDPRGGHDAGVGAAGRGFPADRRPEERRGSPGGQPGRAVHGRLHGVVQLCGCSCGYSHGRGEAGAAANPRVKFQADDLKKRGSVKAETSLSAVEMSGKVIKRGYLLKQVSVYNSYFQI